MVLKMSFWALLFGFLLDLCLGDPHWLPHPIRLIGWLIAKLEIVFRNWFAKTPQGEQKAGVCFTLVVIVLVTGLSVLVLWLSLCISIWLYLMVETIMCYQILATKSLKVESMKVYDRLKANDLEGARYMVSMIVGRDTQNLTEEGVAKAAVETVAENTSDGIIAPLLFMMIGGAPLGFFYKAINTMDSMVGYRNDRYLYFGRFAAKLDDVANYLPARIAAYLMIVAAKLTRMDPNKAYYIYQRDKKNHASPNSAHTEAVCAGALHIQLAGDAYYFGKLCQKQTIGDYDRPIEFEDIVRANRLLYVSACLMLIIALLFRLWILF